MRRVPRTNPGPEKSYEANLTAQEEAIYEAVKLVLAFSEAQLDAEVANGQTIKVKCDG